jgi:hypothetical protein
MKNFFTCYFGAILRARRTFTALADEPRRLQYGLTAVLVTAVLYTFVYLFLVIGHGAPSTFKPWLAIPAEQYYRYNLFFCAPSIFLCWILASGVTHLLSKPFGGKGSFEGTLAVLAFGISLASWTTGIHDVLTSFLGAAGLMDQSWYEVAMNTPTVWRTLLWIQFAAYITCFILLFSKGIMAAQRIRTAPSVLLGVLAFAVYQGIFVIFNR